MSVPSTALSTPPSGTRGTNTASILKMLAASAPQLSRAGKEFAAVSMLDQRFAATNSAFNELAEPIKQWQTAIRTDLQALSQEIAKPSLTPAMKNTLSKNLEEFGASATRLEPFLLKLQQQTTQFKKAATTILDQIISIKSMAKDPALLRDKVQQEAAASQSIKDLVVLKTNYMNEQRTVTENCENLHKEIVRTLPLEVAKQIDVNAPRPDRIEPS